jgi:predicted nucleic acid-binding Zn ribbon protein
MAWEEIESNTGDYNCQSCGDPMKEDVEMCETCSELYEKERDKD